MRDSLHTYIVGLDTPKGHAELDISTSFGPTAAGRRAVVFAAAQGWGDLPDINVTSVTLTATALPVGFGTFVSEER